MDIRRQKWTFLKGVVGVQAVSQLQTTPSCNFSYYLMFCLLGEVICLLCPASQKEQVRGVICVWLLLSKAPAQSGFHGSQHGAVMSVPIPVWVTAAPGWLYGHSYLHHRGTVPITVTAGACISEIRISIKKNHFRLCLHEVGNSFLIPKWEMGFPQSKVTFLALSW